ncbi:hypothetical protein PoB_004107000 [Plakobranchus ocellatus]|uniref:Uncharacterized protein n=1 Tax=Plakobranchus ocellatus TaxID=259542 RepID=A0AAV4B683_9GAST|nr:hypothetical protein PoB_004107000 [Plakobranchus ocellatus]
MCSKTRVYGYRTAFVNGAFGGWRARQGCIGSVHHEMKLDSAIDTLAYRRHFLIYSFVWGPGIECAPPWLSRVVRGDQGRLSPMNCLLSVKGDISFSPPDFVFYLHFLSCAIVPATSPSVVLYFFLFPGGVWDRMDPPHCACRKRRLKQDVAHELPLVITWVTSLFLHLALSSLPTSFPELSSFYFSSSCLLLLSTVALRCWK